MKRERYDKVLWTLLAATLVSLLFVLSGKAEGPAVKTRGGDKAMERQMAYAARVQLLDRIYSPVEALRRAGRPQEALLRLDELLRQYPQEAHGPIIKGEILADLGALDESVACYVAGLQLNGEYADAKSPLSRRSSITRVTDQGLRIIGAEARANPGNRSKAAALKNVNYLRSRLAGGCE